MTDAPVQPIFRRAMGERFGLLHPKIQAHYDITSRDMTSWVGRGTLATCGRGAPWFIPFLMLGAARQILFPERARNVPFTVRNYAYVDSLGRETITWIREYDLPRRQRRFDEYIVYCEQRKRPVVLCGTHQHLAVDLELDADPVDGSLLVRTGGQCIRRREGGFAWPRCLSADAVVRQSYDDAEGFRIEVDVRSKTWGRVFAYHGAFELRAEACARVPARYLPHEVRHEADPCPSPALAARVSCCARVR